MGIRIVVSVLALSVILTAGTAGQNNAGQEQRQNSFRQLDRSPDKSPTALLVSYLIASGALQNTQLHTDRRPAREILADLRKLSGPQLQSLRSYLLNNATLPEQGLDLMGRLLPSGHQEFLFQALARRGWCWSAINSLVNYNDPSLVDRMLDTAKPERPDDLAPIVRPAFLPAIRKRYQAHPSNETAFLIGCYGHAAETDVRGIAASGNRNLRNGALYGLSISKDKSSLSLLRSLVDLSKESEWSLLANRFAMEGPSHVDELTTWLDASPQKEQVAASALSRIKSDKGVWSVLNHLQNGPIANEIAANAAKSSPKATRRFVVDKIAHGRRQQKLNALLVAHHLAGYDRPVPGREHSLVATLLLASHDSDSEVRHDSTKLFCEYASDAGESGGRKALIRLVEMLRDPDARVRGEAAVQVSQYPCPEALQEIKRIESQETDSRARQSETYAANSLDQMLRHLPGMGRRPVHITIST